MEDPVVYGWRACYEEEPRGGATRKTYGGVGLATVNGSLNILMNDEPMIQKYTIQRIFDSDTMLT